MRRSFGQFLKCCAALLLIAAPMRVLAANSVQTAFIPLGDVTTAPIGFVAMCQQSADWCANGADHAFVADVSSIVMPVQQWTSSAARATSGTMCTPSPYGAVSASLTIDIQLAAFAQMAPFGQPAFARDAVGNCRDTAKLFGRRLHAGVTMLPMAITDIYPAATGSGSQIQPVQPGGALSRENRRLLATVNRDVNRRVIQKSDLETVGQADVWRRAGTAPGASGDCEDIAIEKRYELVAKGFPAERLTFAIGYSSEAGLHMVLVARTEKGDLILDSRTARIASWSAAPYRWLTVQSNSDLDIWYRVAA